MARKKPGVYTFAQQVTPLAFRFQVKHYEAALPEHSRDNESEFLVFVGTVIHDAVVTQMSPSRSDYLRILTAKSVKFP